MTYTRLAVGKRVNLGLNFSALMSFPKNALHVFLNLEVNVKSTSRSELKVEY